MKAPFGIALLVALVLWGAAMARAETAGPLTLERKISLGDVSGRIDHMGIDLRRNRLLVAELGNGSVGVVDLAQGVVVHRVVGLSGPQGVSYFPGTDTVYVANGGDGMVRLFTAEDMAPIARLALGKDADNIRIDTQARQVLVGYGDGGLAMIDGTTGLQTGAIPLPVHPEGFQLDPQGRRVFVNLADRNEIGVIDRAAKQITGRWSVAGLRSNFPMALDDTGERVFVGFRHPERLAVFDARDGEVLANLDTCSDADDVSYDAKRRRLYVSCGEGAVDVIQQGDAGYSRLARVPTERGARTSLFVPEFDRLYVAARAAGSEPAAILVFRPSP